MRSVLILFLCAGAFAATTPNLLKTAPLRFEPAFEPAKGAVQWTARGSGYAFGFAPSATLMRLGDRAVRMSFEGGSTTARYEGLDRSKVQTNYFTGQESTSVPAFGRLRSTGAATPALVDARNIWRRADVTRAGLRYQGIGAAGGSK